MKLTIDTWKGPVKIDTDHFAVVADLRWRDIKIEQPQVGDQIEGIEIMDGHHSYMMSDGPAMFWPKQDCWACGEVRVTLWRPLPRPATF